jgi:hypothetical protein
MSVEGDKDSQEDENEMLTPQNGESSAQQAMPAQQVIPIQQVAPIKSTAHRNTRKTATNVTTIQSITSMHPSPYN